jgi:hypothetical protein
MAVEVKRVPDLKAFLGEARARNVRVIRLADHGLVEAAQRSGAWVMQPRVRITATLLDREVPEIHAYEEKRDANETVTIVVGKGNGEHRDHGMVARREQLRTLFQDEGFTVETGEWTPAAAEAYLQTRKAALG